MKYIGLLNRSFKLAITTLVFFMGQVHATTIVHRGFEELVQRSGIIFEGEVLSQYSAFSEDKKTIYTFVTFSNKQVLKGSIAQPTIELRFTGGKVGNTRVIIPDMPQFQKGERTILFLNSDFDPSKTYSPISGFNQGQFSIKSDEKGMDLIYTADGSKIIGYNVEDDQLKTVSASANRKKNVPIAHDPKKDVLVQQSASLEKSQFSIRKIQFTEMISSFVKKHGLKGSQFEVMPAKDKMKSIQFDAVPAPEMKEPGVK